MKTVKTILLIFAFSIPACIVNAQPDTLIKERVKISGAYFSMGFDIVRSGMGGVIGGTMLLSNNWGVSFRFNPNAQRAKNFPDDYNDLFLGIPFLMNGIPSDNVSAVSFHVVKEYQTKTPLTRLGVEFGPAYIKYEEAVFTPVDGWIPLLGSNYDVTHDIDKSIGFSVRGKLEFPVTRFAGIETSLYSVINRLHPFFGVDFIVTLGLVR